MQEIFNLGFLASEIHICDIQSMNETLGKTIGNRLKDLKKSKDWLAETCEVSNAAVTKWIKTGKVSRENTIKVANALGISIDELLNEKIDGQDPFKDQLDYFYAGLSDEGRHALAAHANYLHSMEKPEKSNSNPFTLMNNAAHTRAPANINGNKISNTVSPGEIKNASATKPKASKLGR